MNQEIKQRWIQALRSGEYKQGTSTLKFQDRFCCLGVLCDLHAKETGNEWNDYPEEGFRSDYLEDEATLPDAVMDWAGLSEHDPVVRTGESTVCGIAYYNDREKYKFDELADLIEMYL